MKNRTAFGITLSLLLIGVLTSTFVSANTGVSWTENLESVGATDASVTEASDWWPMFHHDLHHTGYSISTAPNTNNTIWNYTTGSYVGSSPTVVDGEVFVGSFDGKVYCLDAVTGVHIWNFTTSGAVRSSPAVADGKVYVGSYNGKFYCLDALNGAFVWSYTTGSSVFSSPTVADGRVYVGSGDYNVYCFGPSAAAPDIAVTNLTSCYGSTVLAQNRTYRVDINVTNEGSAVETFTLTLNWNTTNYINSTTVTLEVSETKTVSLDWNTTGYQRYAYYKLSAHATPLPGESDTGDNTYVDPRDLYMAYPGDVMPLPKPDKKVDILDVAAIAKLFGVNRPDPKYDPDKDITCDGKIDIKDVAIAAKAFGYVEP